MSIKKKNIIVECLDKVLKVQGFKRLKKNWYCQGKETILMVNLQKLNFGDQFQIGLGGHIRSLCYNLTPKMNEFHIVEQLSRLVLQNQQTHKSIKSFEKLDHVEDIQKIVDTLNDNNNNNNDNKSPFELTLPVAKKILKTRSGIQKALDLEDYAVGEEERAYIIIEAMLSTGLPFLQKCISVEKIRQNIQSDQFKGAGIRKVVYDLLRLPIP